MTKSGLVFVLGIFVYLQTRISVDAVIGTALYCRDPDTGKLHAPNTTWPSTTFCGNYACRLRKKNDSVIEHNQNAPKTDPDNPMNISNNDNSVKSQHDNVINDNRQFVSSDQSQQITRKSNYEMQPDSLERMETKADPSYSKPNVIVHDNAPSKKHFQISKLEEALGDNDRYLSEDEIKIISELLYTVKKSDLEAIVDIYNLAQDIYNEMERPSANDMLNFQKQKDNSESYKSYVPLEPVINKNSYWYEPLQNDATLKSETQADLLLEPSNMLLSSPAGIGNVASTQSPQGIPLQASDEFKNLPNNNLGTNYQSYLQRIPTKTVIQPVNPYAKKMAVHPVQPAQRVFAPQWSLQKTGESLINSNNVIHPRSILLPYPFSYIRYNLTSAPNAVYYGKNPYNNIGVNVPNNQNEVQVNTQPKLSVVNPLVLDVSSLTGSSKRNSLTKFLTDVRFPLMNNNMPNTIYTPEKQYAVENRYASENKYIPENMYEAEYKHALETKFIPENSLPRIVKKPGWLSDSLPEHIIEAIRAKIDNANGDRAYKSYFPAKRMVKVEKVGKTMWRNEAHSRKKRDQGWDDYEVVIERKTCVTDETIGFFRKGNESEPFPKCCPQRIQVW